MCIRKLHRLHKLLQLSTQTCILRLADEGLQASPGIKNACKIRHLLRGNLASQLFMKLLAMVGQAVDNFLLQVLNASDIVTQHLAADCCIHLPHSITDSKDTGLVLTRVHGTVCLLEAIADVLGDRLEARCSCWVC